LRTVFSSIIWGQSVVIKSEPPVFIRRHAATQRENECWRGQGAAGYVAAMPIGLLKDIYQSAPSYRRLLGLDIGEKTIGLSVCDPMHSIATPLHTVQRVKFTKDIEELHKTIKEFEIGGYVLGYPVNMDGTEGPRCQSVRHFAEELVKYPQIVGTNPWIALWDERLSTASVDRFLVDDVDMSRTKRKQVVDKLAAQFILQGALDFLSFKKR
jgi:putative Holliday junction resolvase